MIFFFRMVFFFDTSLFFNFPIYIRVIWKKVFPEFLCLHWFSRSWATLRKVLTKMKILHLKTYLHPISVSSKTFILKKSVQLFSVYKYSIFLALKHITIRRDEARTSQDQEHESRQIKNCENITHSLQSPYIQQI